MRALFSLQNADSAAATAAAARPAPRLQRVPLAGGAFAVLALAWSLAGGPDASARPVQALAVLAVLLLAGALLRRGWVALRSGEALVVAVGALAMLVVGALWAITATLGGGQLAFATWTCVIGMLLGASSLLRLRTRSAPGTTPWQSLADGQDARAVLVDLVGLLGGTVVFLGGAWVGASWFVDRLSTISDIFDGRSLALLMLAGTFVLVLFAAAAVVAGYWGVRMSPRAASGTAPVADGTTPLASAAPVPARDEQTVAAHLHDSVLQTLALINRNAEDPARVQQLARQQERSLRAWLAGRDEAKADTLAGAVRVAAQEVEDEEPGARIEVVAVGDAPFDRAADAMVRAAREAMRNAVRHAGSPVRVFVEVEGKVREVFIRDTGAGFDLAQISEERRGVRDAIIGRMEHVGGTAAIDSSAAGTEIALRFDASSNEGGVA